MNKRVNIEEVENGYTVRVHEEHKEESNDYDMMYPEPKEYVALSKDEVVKLLKDKL